MQAASNIIWQQDFSSQTTTIDTLIQKGWSTSGSAPYSWTLKSYGRTGKSLILDIPPGSGVDESKTVELKTPNIQLDDNAQLTFWYYNKFDGDISVYVSLDGGKTWTDNALKKGLSQASSWTKVACSLTDYPSKTVQIVFAVTGANKSQYQQSIRIDDILIDEAPLCKKTVNLFVDQIKQTSAVLHWDLSEVGAETEQYILNVTDVDGNEISNNTPILAPNRSTTITGLNANTEYIVTLTADCSDDHKGSSDPSEKLRFTTIVDPMAIPLETFDAERKLPLGWSSENSTMDQYTKYGDKGYSVKIQATKDRDAKLFSPPIVNAANDTYVSFRLYSANEGSIYQVGLTSDPSDVTAFESLWRDTVKIAKQWIDIRVNMADTKKYGAEQGKHIVIFIPKGNYTVLNVDHFSVSSIPACPRAERLKIMDIDSTLCRISWLDYASSASKYEVRVVDVANLDTTYRDDVTSRPADIAGLVGSTEYELSVRPVCSDGEEIDWSLPVKFTTECQTVPAADFKEDFNLDRNRLPQCWTALSASEGNKLWDIYGYVGKNSSAAARFNRYFGESSLLISRPFSVSEIGKYDVSFEIKRPSFGTVEGEGIRLWISNTTDTVGAQCCEFINNGYQFPPVEKTRMLGTSMCTIFRDKEPYI